MRPLIFILAGLALLGSVAPGLACAISLGTAGRMDLSSDKLTMGSEEGNDNRSGTVFTALSLFETAHIDVAAPTLTSWGTGYNQTTQTIEYAYSADVLSLGLLNVATQGYTTAPSSFATGLLGAVTITVTLENRIHNPNGFAAGTYRTQQVVTCRP